MKKQRNVEAKSWCLECSQPACHSRVLPRHGKLIVSINLRMQERLVWFCLPHSHATSHSSVPMRLIPEFTRRSPKERRSKHQYLFLSSFQSVRLTCLNDLAPPLPRMDRQLDTHGDNSGVKHDLAPRAPLRKAMSAIPPITSSYWPGA